MLTQLSRLKYAFFKRPKYQRIFAYLTTAYLSYAIILGLIIPYTIVSFAPEKISQLLGRPVSVGEVRINPFTYQVALTQLTIKEKDNKPFAGISTLQLEVNFWQSVFNRALVIEHIHLQGPYVQISRAQKQGKEGFNFDDILTTLAQNSAASTSAEPEEPTEPLRVLLGQFTLTAGTFSFDDHITQARVNYPSINIKLSQLDTEYSMAAKGQELNTAVTPPEQPESKTQSVAANTTSNTSPLVVNNHFAIQLKDDHEGEISLEGQFQLSPLKLVGDVQIAKLKLTPLWQFVDEQFYVALNSGEISAKTDYQIDLSDDTPLKLRAERGQIILEKLNIINKEQQVVHLPLLAIDGIDTDLQQQRIHIKQIHSEGLALHALLDEQGIDLERLFTPKSQISSQVPPKNHSTAPDTQSNSQDTAPSVAGNTNAKPMTQPELESAWRVQLDGLSLKNYDINITEHKLSTTPQQWRIYPLALSTQAIVSDLKNPIEYEVSLAINGKGNFASQGQVDVASGAIEAKLQVNKLVLEQFQPYLAPYVNIQLKSGFFSSEGQLSADAKGKAIYQGSVDLDDLTILDNLRNAPLVKWQKMHINQLDFDQQKNRIDIDQLAFDQPYAKVVIAKDRSTNISNLVVETPAAPSSTNSPQGAKTGTKVVKTVSSPTAPHGVSARPELSLNIQKISFSQGSAFFADNSLTPNFASGIEQLEGNIKHLSSTPGTIASVDIKGKIDKYAPVTLKGEVNPLLDMPYLDLDLVFKNVELTSVNPYSGTYAGYYIDKGQLSLVLNYQLERNQLKGSNHFVIDQLKLGKPSNSRLATSLPITLAIALLQDRNGVIDLGMEVSGDLDSPSFSVGSIIMTAITNVITKAVTAPFSFLAGLVGSDEALDKINFSAGNFALDSKAQESLDKLASALTDRPMLKLSIEGGVDAINDSQFIAERMMKRKLAKLANIQLSELPADLSPSQFPTQGPLAEALIKLYEQEVAADPQLIKDTIANDAIVNDTKDTQLTDDEITTRWHIALYNLCVKAQNVTDGMLGDLAQERAKTVKSYLVETKGIAPERIFLLESRVTLSHNAAQVNMTIDVP